MSGARAGGALCSALLLAAAFSPAPAPAGPPPGPGQPGSAAPGIALPLFAGGTISLRDLRGKVVVVEFWATWCPPCCAALDNLAGLSRAYAGKGLAVVGIALDREGAAAVGPYVREEGIPFPIALGDREIRAAFGGIDSIPTTFLIGREGKVAKKLVGYHPYEELEGELASLL